MGENLLPNGIRAIQFGKISEEAVVVVVAIIDRGRKESLPITGTLQEVTQFFAMISHDSDGGTCLLELYFEC